MTARLDDRHRAELEASAIAPDVAEARGYQSIMSPRAIPDLFRNFQRERAGLLMPIRDFTGEVVSYQLKPDEPRIDRTTGRPIKYETAMNAPICIDVPAAVLPHLRSVDIPLWISEGCKKVDSALSHGVPCIVGLQGIDAWSSQGVTLPDWKEIQIRGRRVVIAFDSDVMTKASARRSLERFGAWLTRQGAEVEYLVMPDLPDGGKCGLDDWFASGRTYNDLQGMTTATLPGSVMDWEPPIPLDPTTGPPFPLEALPGTLGEFVAAVAEETQTAPDLPALVALGTVSAAAGGKFQTYYAPTNWREPVHIMVTPVAESGNNKSGVFRQVVEPLRRWEAEQQEAERPRIAEWESKHRRLEKQLAIAEQQAGKADAGGLSESEAVRMAAVKEVEEHLKERPVLTEVFTDDATPEAVKELLAEQGGAVAVMSAESAYLSNVAGRYSDAPHLDTILNGHAGDLVKVKRKGKPTEHIERACLSLCLMLQPEVIEAIGKVDGFRSRGGAARLLPAFPADRIGRRKMTTTAVPDGVVSAWGKMVQRVLELPRGDDPATLMLDREAEAAFTRFRVAVEPAIKAEGRDMQRWLSKYAGAVLRIAGLLHIATHECPASESITADTIARAVAIGRYFHAHARIMYRVMYGNGGSAAGIVLDFLRTVEGETITRRDLYQRLRGRAAFQTAADLVPALAMLEEYGWIRQESGAHDGPGRPSPVIHLNPELHTQNTQNPTEQDTGTNIEYFEYGTPQNQKRETDPPTVTPLRPTGTDSAWGEDF